MNIKSINKIERIQNNLHYIRRYTALLHFSLSHTGDISTPIRFSIEHDAMGIAKINVDFIESIDYPLIPARKKVIELVKNYEKEGKLN